MRYLRIFMTAALLMSVSQLAQAQDARVAGWVSEVLTSTLSISYQDPHGYLKTKRPYYTLNAWDALRSFLGEYVTIVKDNQLSLRPQVVKAATVTDDGHFSGIHYWRVNETIQIPELYITIDFSVVVLATSSDTQPYVIQSLNMVKYQN